MNFEFEFKFECTYRASFERELDSAELVDWTPTFCDQTFGGDVKVEEVHTVIYCLGLAHLDRPVTDTLSCRLQQTITVILRLSQHLKITSTFIAYILTKTSTI